MHITYNGLWLHDGVNCKKHRHFRQGLQEPHIYGIVPKSTNFFYNFLQKTLVARLDRFKYVYDMGVPLLLTWLNGSQAMPLDRRFYTNTLFGKMKKQSGPWP
jgi:hypothetical protein